jgi:hypothetical protein
VPLAGILNGEPAAVWSDPTNPTNPTNGSEAADFWAVFVVGSAVWSGATRPKI